MQSVPPVVPLTAPPRDDGPLAWAMHRLLRADREAAFADWMRQHQPSPHWSSRATEAHRDRDRWLDVVQALRGA